MKSEIVQRPQILLAGVVGSGKDVNGINIRELWNSYNQSDPKIEHRVEGAWYELHIGEKQGNGIYSVLAGVQIEKVGTLPAEISVKVLPAGKYIHFAHCMKDGGFGEAFAEIEAWIKENRVEVKDFGLQHYDAAFDPNNKDSILHIYIPLED